MSESLEPNYETEKSKDLSHHRILTGRLITTADLCTQFIEEFSENGVIKYMVQLVRDDNLALSRCVNMRVESLLSGANGREFEICLADLKAVRMTGHTQ